MFILRDLPKYEALLALADRYPELEVPAVESCLTFLSTSADLHRGLDEHFAQHNLSMGKFTLLMLLYKADRDLTPEEFLTPSDCATMAGVTKGTITGLLDGLERQNWIERRPHSADGRRTIIALTESGRSRLEAFLPHHFRLISQMTTHLSESEMETLQSLLLKLRTGTLEATEREEVV